ncbi:hypothetical protein NDU88_008013 [Pleurodeles waltl]|uniref:Uncharacterized protein n=1 Tax=Pleurodeles waltl TaxID=8319 RepID=A0AAV7N713_PLEWA|nr:hypothetical protein NDU88_008013 [Pleurodeles waltl]
MYDANTWTTVGVSGSPLKMMVDNALAPNTAAKYSKCWKVFQEVTSATGQGEVASEEVRRTDHDNTLFKAAFMLVFFGAYRVSELVAHFRSHPE